MNGHNYQKEKEYSTGGMKNSSVTSSMEIYVVNHHPHKRAKNARQRTAMAPNQHPIVKWMDDALRDSGFRDKWLKEKAGFSMWCLQSWRRGHRPRIDMIDAALGTLGYQLAIVDSDTGEVMWP